MIAMWSSPDMVMSKSDLKRTTQFPILVAARDRESMAHLTSFKFTFEACISSTFGPFAILMQAKICFVVGSLIHDPSEVNVIIIH